jgi:hypothetical protein
VDRRVTEIDDRLEDLGDPELEEAYLLEMEKISLISKNAQILNFGTPFDYGGIEVSPNYYEVLEQERTLTSDEIEARDNRSVLYNAMMMAGMQPYADEWWHYNSPKSQIGAKSAGLDHAEYGGVELSKGNILHETMRRMHHMGLIGMQLAMLKGNDPGGRGKIGFDDPELRDLINQNVRALRDFGDHRVTNFLTATIIEPAVTTSVDVV